MNLKNCSTALFVKDINRSKQFYSGVMGLTIETDMGKNVIFEGGLTIWEVNMKHIVPAMLGNERILTKSNRFELYFETEEIDEVYNEVTKAGVKYLHEMHEEPWGQRTIRFFDPDDNLIEIGESMESFIGRMYSSGMTLQEISVKTSISESDLARFINQAYTA